MADTFYTNLKLMRSVCSIKCKIIMPPPGSEEGIMSDLQGQMSRSHGHVMHLTGVGR